ncbi:MAG TPA: kelch repeat-containing protein [Myxococcales bacterium]|nr:kelch repeat-containing protein [Myxococcales bacterium]
MTRSTKQTFLPAVAALALGAAACSAGASGDIPCVEDVTCPAAYPVCGPQGKCIEGTSAQKAEVTIVGPEGYMPTELVGGSVRMLVAARATTGVASVKLASGTTNFTASAAPATPPLYAFDIDTTVFPDGDVPLSATVSAGDGSTGSATGTLHVDNATIPPIKITSFSVGTSPETSSGTKTITSGQTTKLFASFAGRVSVPATLSCAPSCNGTLAATTVANGGSVDITGSTNGTLTYTLTVSPSSGPDATKQVTVKVVPPANAISLTNSTPVIHQGGSATLTPVFDFGPSPVVPGTASIVGSDGSVYGNLTSGLSVQVAPNNVPTATYTLNVFNAAGTVASSAPAAVVSVASGFWSSFNTNTFSALRGATVTALDDGRVLIAGGVDVGNTPQSTAYLCDATGACAVKSGPSGMQSARAWHTAVKIGSAPNNAGKVLLVGGYTAAGPATPASSAEFYDPQTDSFTSTTAITGARARHVAVLLADDRTVLLAGGTSGSGNLDTASKYDAGAAVPTVTPVGPMAQQRASFTGTLLISGKVLILGGTSGNVAAELFDPSAGFSAGPSLPAGEDKRMHTTVLISGASSNSGKVLVSGGLTGAGTPSSTQFLYNPGSPGSFTAVAALAMARSNHAAISLPTDSILICGGLDSGSSTLKSCERYDPSSGTGTQYPTAQMFEARRDFGLAAMLISSQIEILAAGSPSTPNSFVETYNPN